MARNVKENSSSKKSQRTLPMWLTQPFQSTKKYMKKLNFEVWFVFKSLEKIMQSMNKIKKNKSDG